MARYAYPIVDTSFGGAIGIATSAQKAAELIDELASASLVNRDYVADKDAEEIREGLSEDRFVEIRLAAHDADGFRQKTYDKTVRITRKPLNEITTI